jgi:hypothetical protein
VAETNGLRVRTMRSQIGKIVALDEKAVHPFRHCTAVQFGESGRVKTLREGDMKR